MDDVPDPVWDTIAELPHEQERALIEALVRRHLLPLVEAAIGNPIPIPIALWGSNNPIRHAETTGEAPKDWPEIDVTLDERQVVETMRELGLPVPEGY